MSLPRKKKKMSLPQLPREIIEIILYHCDGQTLVAARKVNDEWENIVKYLNQRYNIWKERCSKVIPKHELCLYNRLSNGNWQDIYETRLLWQNIKENIEISVDNFEKKTKCTGIRSIAVSNTCVGVVLDRGKILIFDSNGLLINQFNHFMNYEITSLHFVHDDEEIPTDMFIICRTMLITPSLSLNYINAHDIVDSYETFDVYKDFFCGISTHHNNLIIRQLIDYEVYGQRHRIISDVPIDEISTIGFGVQHIRMLSEDICVVLYYKTMFLVERKQSSSNQDMNAQFIVRKITCLPVLNKAWFIYNTQKIWIMNENIVLATSPLVPALDDRTPQTVDLNIYKNSGEVISKYFVPQKVFACMISYIHLQSNTLIIGTMSGSLYFYEINELSDWETFDIAKYSHTMDMGGTFGPVLCIRMIQSETQRKFYVASRWNRIEIVSGHAKKCIR